MANYGYGHVKLRSMNHGYVELTLKASAVLEHGFEFICAPNELVGLGK